MMISEKQLRKIIREEVEKAYLEEGIWDDIKGAFKGKKPESASEKAPESSLTKEKSMMKFLDMYAKEFERATGTDDIFGQAIKDFGPKGRFSAIRSVKGGDALYSELRDQVNMFVKKRNEMAAAILKNLETAKAKLTSPEAAKVVKAGGIEGEFNPYAKGPFESKKHKGKAL